MFISRTFMKLRAGASQELEGTWRQDNMQSGHQHDSNTFLWLFCINGELLKWPHTEG